jgi:hypothetical protein
VVDHCSVERFDYGFLAEIRSLASCRIDIRWPPLLDWEVSVVA